MGTIKSDEWCRPQRYYDQDSWRGTWAYDGGVLSNQASHHVDLLEWMMGDVESVFAKSTTALVNIEAEDTAVVALKFKNGALGYNLKQLRQHVLRIWKVQFLSWVRK